MGISARQFDDWKRQLIGEYNEVGNSLSQLSNKKVIDLETMKFLLSSKKSLEKQIDNYERDVYFY